MTLECIRRTGEKIIALFNGISVSSYWRVSAVRMDAS